MAEWLESGKGPLKRSRSETSLATFRNTGKLCTNLIHRVLVGLTDVLLNARRYI